MLVGLCMLHFYFEAEVLFILHLYHILKVPSKSFVVLDFALHVVCTAQVVFFYRVLVLYGICFDAYLFL